MKRSTVILWSVIALLATIVLVISISGYWRLGDLWLAPVVVLAGAIVELVKASVEIAKATHKPFLDEDEEPKP